MVLESDCMRYWEELFKTLGGVLLTLGTLMLRLQHRVLAVSGSLVQVLGTGFVRVRRRLVVVGGVLLALGLVVHLSHRHLQQKSDDLEDCVKVLEEQLSQLETDRHAGRWFWERRDGDHVISSSNGISVHFLWDKLPVLSILRRINRLKHRIKYLQKL